jgi:hypothetical protein
MRMLEEFCREMHSTKILESDDEHINSITNKQFHGVFMDTSNQIFEDINTNKPAEAKRLEKNDSCLDGMINELRSFEQNVYAQLYWSFNNCPPYNQMNKQSVPTVNNKRKRRKMSESDSLFNVLSTDTTVQTCTCNIPEIFGSLNKINPDENFSDQDSRVNSQKTAFTQVHQTYMNVPQMNEQNGLFKPIAMPSLNQMSSNYEY